jgi:hypothetical protein
MGNLIQLRSRVLSDCGATSAEIEELLRYNENNFDFSLLAETEFPLGDEAFVSDWQLYADEVRAAGSIDALRRNLIQLNFPICAGMSQNPDYLAATTRGLAPSADVAGVAFEDPSACRIEIHSTPAGRIPLLITPIRADFISLVRALTRRNEPSDIPDSMGACMVAGYNNWTRIRKVLAQNGTLMGADKGLYQDRFIILSKGFYSGVSAAAMDLPEAEWRELSFIIRREHECAHYFTRRVMGSMRNNLLDEVIADYCGIVAAIGRFRSDWFLRFLGLEDYPRYRQGGRLQNYRGKPPLSSGAFLALQKLVKRVAENLEAFSSRFGHPVGHSSPGSPLLALSAFTLEELADCEAVFRLERAGIENSRLRASVSEQFIRMDGGSNQF